MSKITIEIEDGRAKVFIDGGEIGSMYDGKATLIESLNLSVNRNFEAEPVRLEIIFANMLGGLYEADHKEIAKSLRDSIRTMRKLDDPNVSIDSSIRFFLNTDRLFEGIA